MRLILKGKKMITQNTKKVNEKLADFQNHKQFAEKIQQILALTYTKFDLLNKTETLAKRGQDILECGSKLAFQRYFDEDQTSTLYSANFCKHKLCPYCAWRWHLKQSRILSKTFELLGKQNYYHLVLTIPNIAFLTKDFLLTLRQKTNIFMRKVVNSLDYFIGFEITIDQTGKYHPHFHIVYIDHNEKPITRKRLQTEWARVANTGTNYAIAKQTKCTGEKVSLELTKYILKFDNIEPNSKQLKTIRIATKGIRKFSTSGAVKQAESEAKRIIEREKFDEFTRLENYDSVIDFYEWIGHNYQLIESKQAKASDFSA